MCGIFGWDLHPRHVSRIQLSILGAMLAHSMDDRGGDSWGYVVPGSTPVKGLGQMAGALVRSQPYRLLAHTRKGTTGSVTVENSHPFSIGKFIGVHNGIISNHITLNNKHDRKCQVDSEHIYHHLSEGLDLSELVGYGMLAYLHKDHPDRTFLSNARSGSISVRGIGKGSVGGIIFASTDSALKAALSSAGLNDHEEYDIKEGKTYYTKECKLFKDVDAPDRKFSTWGAASSNYHRTGGSEESYHMGGGWGAGPDVLRQEGWTEVDLFGTKKRTYSSLSSKSSSDTKTSPPTSLSQTGQTKHHQLGDYSRDMRLFFERVVADVEHVIPEDFPAYSQWEALSGHEKNILTRAPNIIMSDQAYLRWLYERQFSWNPNAMTAFRRWLREGKFEEKKDTDAAAIALHNAANAAADAVTQPGVNHATDTKTAKQSHGAGGNAAAGTPSTAKATIS